MIPDSLKKHLQVPATFCEVKERLGFVPKPNPFSVLRFCMFFALACYFVYGLRPEFGVAAGERILPNPPAITADAAVLVDMETGGIIYAKNGDKQEYPASTTKMMTAILSLEQGDNNKIVEVSPYAAYVESTAMWGGEHLRQFELIELMLLESDNGAATALGESVGGSESAFVAMMNAKAAELGMTGTHFVNCNGMPDEDHYSTARDLARLARYAMQNTLFRRVVASPTIIMPNWSDPTTTYEAENTNDLLETYPGCIGIKTGYTRAAGGCLVSAAERDGRTILCVVLKSEDMDARFSDSAALLDYGFLCAENGLAVLPEN